MNMTLKKIINLLSQRKILFISLVITVILTFVLNKIEKEIIVNDSMNFFQLQVSFSNMVFNEIIKSWGNKGVSLYVGTLWVDCIYALAYAFLISSAILFFKRRKTNYSIDGLKRVDLVFILLPFFGALCDNAENILHLMILTKDMQDLVMTASIMSSVKWTVLVASLAYFLMTYFSFRKEMRAQASTRR